MSTAQLMKVFLIRLLAVAATAMVLLGAATVAAQASEGSGGGACRPAQKHCAPYTVRVEAVAGVAPVTGTLSVKCRKGFIRGTTAFGALTSDSLVSVTFTEARPRSYTIKYTMLNTVSGGMYLETECVRTPKVCPNASAKGFADKHVKNSMVEFHEEVLQRTEDQVRSHRERIRTMDLDPGELRPEFAHLDEGNDGQR